MRRVRLMLALAAVFGLAAGPAAADSAYTTLDLGACRELARYEGGGFDLACPGYKANSVIVREGDARMEVDYGSDNPWFETFHGFNNVGETIEWVSDDKGVQATILRFFIGVDGREAQALVVSRVGSKSRPGCVIGVVDAATEQANGIARGLAAMAYLFDCGTDPVRIVPGASTLVSGFSGAAGTR